MFTRPIKSSSVQSGSSDILHSTLSLLWVFFMVVHGHSISHVSWTNGCFAFWKLECSLCSSNILCFVHKGMQVCRALSLWIVWWETWHCWMGSWSTIVQTAMSNNCREFSTDIVCLQMMNCSNTGDTDYIVYCYKHCQVEEEKICLQ